MKIKLFFYAPLLIVCFLLPTLAQCTAVKKTSYLNVKKAKANIEAINRSLTNRGLKISQLRRNVERLDAIQDSADECVKNSEGQLAEINQLLKTARVNHTLPLQHDDYEYLKTKKLFYAKHLSECRFIVFRSQDILVSFRDKIKEINGSIIIEREDPIWTSFAKLFQKPLIKNVSKQLSLRSLIENISFLLWGIGIALLAATLFFSLSVRKFLLQIKDDKKKSDDHLFESLSSASAEFTIPLLMLIALTCFVYILSLSSNDFGTLLSISLSLLLLVIAMFASKFLCLFYMPYQNSNSLGHQLYQCTLILLFSLYIGFFTYKILFSFITFFPHVLIVLKSIFMALIFSILSLCMLILLKHANNTISKKRKKMQLSVFTYLLISLFAVSLLADFLGYHRLSLYIGLGSIFSLTLLLGAAITLTLLNQGYKTFNEGTSLYAKKLQSIFGVKPNKAFMEISLLQHILSLIVIAFTLITLMRIWHVAPNIIESIVDGLVDGFNFFDLVVRPLRIVGALLSFCFIMLLGRLFATRVASKQQFKGQGAAQVTIVSLILYVTFSLAVLFAMLTLGVNFTGLAIIAGALSVGVGLGLQNIVNNFVSGIILLIEKPIKPGDRVVIADTEGFVKKISIRSTRITTMSKEDVIVPNADLISNQITNYMFRDKQWRIVSRVGVAYGSNTDLVEKVLLEVAAQNESVSHEPPDLPSVLFKEFGESSLDFELWCIIKDVNLKYRVQSQLNFAIEKAFKKHHIEIAFPQRDVHIKQS